MSDKMNVILDSENNRISKISTLDYIEDPSKLQIMYVPFDTKMQIAGHVVSSIAKAIGGMNSSLFRRISIEVIIENITNIDMTVKDENELAGFDQLLYYKKLDGLLETLGDEYNEFKKIIDERFSDYLRTETNSALTLEHIYSEVKSYFEILIEQVNKYLNSINIDGLNEQTVSPFVEVGDSDES